MTNDERKAILFEAAGKGRGLYDDERDELAALLRSGSVNAEESARIRAAFPKEYAYLTAPENRVPLSRVGQPRRSSNRGPLFAVVAIIAIVVLAGIAGLTAKSDAPRTARSQSTEVTAQDTAGREAPANDDRQQQASDAHAKRDVARSWYMHIVNNMAIAIAGAQYATAHFSEDNSVDMSSLLKKSSGAADSCKLRA